ncbi:MAG: adenine-specific methyltransferase EcoRI family protein [Bacteroidales bacterium]|nr:adenine-specific methyltransferase EcoRI family protein [Bacteroidales bacterium]
MAKNDSLHKAKRAKADEFYTQLSDIENECRHYKEHFKGKTILCNCDDPRVSNFFRYFSLNFEHLGLKKLIATCYKSQDINLFSEGNTEKAVYIVYEGDKNGNKKVDDNELDIKELQGDGDFRSKECIELLKEADIVVTNPPFSLFREYVALLMEYEKKFLIIGNKNALTYKEVFSLLKANKIWTGVRGFSGGMWFKSDYEGKTEKIITDKEGNAAKIINVPSIWFTNLDHSKRHERLILYETYTPEKYPKYDNYDAIEVKKTAEIPMDYDGIMGVPITFLDKYNPEQFEILGLDDHRVVWRGRGPELNGKCVYRRIIIRKK